MDRPSPTPYHGPLKITNVLEEAEVDGGRWPHLDVDVPQSVARGRALFCSSDFTAVAVPPDAHLGVDLLRLGPGEAFPLHTHPGHHLLLVIQGRGTVTVDGVVHATRPGDLYLVDGGVPHAVGAHPAEPHYLAAFGAPHTHVDDPARMTVLPA